MSDNLTAATNTPKGRGGWPKGRSRKAPPTKPTERFAKFRAERDNLEWQDLSGEDRFHIDSEILEKLRREGIEVRWVVETCLGQEQSHEISKLERNGWQRVGDEIPEIRVTDIGGCHLYMNSTAMAGKSRRAEETKARDAITTLRAKHGEGIPNVTGADHPSARRFNRHRSTIERVDVPE